MDKEIDFNLNLNSFVNNNKLNIYTKFDKYISLHNY